MKRGKGANMERLFHKDKGKMSTKYCKGPEITELLNTWQQEAATQRKWENFIWEIMRKSRGSSRLQEHDVGDGWWWGGEQTATGQVSGITC